MTDIALCSEKVGGHSIEDLSEGESHGLGNFKPFIFQNSHLIERGNILDILHMLLDYLISLGHKILITRPDLFVPLWLSRGIFFRCVICFTEATQTLLIHMQKHT